MRTTNGIGIAPAGSIFTGDGTTTLSGEIDFRMQRLADEARRERTTERSDGLRQLVGHALMALGSAIHGVEPEHPARPALGAR